MKPVSLLGFFFIAAGFGFPLFVAAAQRQPSVVVILTDDQGAVDMNI